MLQIHRAPNQVPLEATTSGLKPDQDHSRRHIVVNSFVEERMEVGIPGVSAIHDWSVISGMQSLKSTPVWKRVTKRR